jgi:uncharacterized membrane protein YbhN (UPF0104 family)
MKPAATIWVRHVLRWGIAIAGIAWVAANMSLADYVLLLDADSLPVRVKLAAPAAESAATFEVLDPVVGRRTVGRDMIVNPVDRAEARATWTAPRTGRTSGRILGLDLGPDLQVQRILVEDPQSGRGIWLAPAELEEPYVPRIPRPRIEVGIASLVAMADTPLLLLALAVFPIGFLVTTYRWYFLLKAADIQIPLRRVFVLNMVGAFYNSFIPGTTGGDLLKAYYASRHTPHRVGAVMSVIVDRALGLVALIIMGGVMAAGYYFTGDPRNVAARQACLQVALGAVVLLGGAVLVVEVLVQPWLRGLLGIAYLLGRLPARQRLRAQHVIELVTTYRRRGGLALGMILLTLPVHITTVISATLAGNAFGLPLPLFYYFVCVPVIVLSGALPISPQGAGVMEFFAIALTQQYGTTVTQAVALTLSIRLVAILWNLTGGIFVFRGGYHAPTAAEQEELEHDTDEPPVALTPPPAAPAGTVASARDPA